jgi:hypothetical protein
MPERRAPKMALGFVVRQCTKAIGHTPSPREFRDWANKAGNEDSAIFGRHITEDEAAVILRNLARPVTARDASAFMGVSDADGEAPERSEDVRDKVVDFEAIRARRSSRKS